MSKLIKLVRNLHRVEFDQGRFDEWCVYLQRDGQERTAPLDTQYFEFFRQKGVQYGARKVYRDFVQIYTPTTANIEPRVLNLITSISNTYGNDAEEMDIWFSVIYGGMIAEENKAHMVLKKRIKRLGMHQVMVENMAPAVAAKFSLGKKWRELDALMKECGF